MHALNFWRYVTRYQPTVKKAIRGYFNQPTTETVRPVETELCSEEEARQKFQEFLDCYETGGGANLRVELVSGLPGVRLTLVGDWEDMS